MPIASSTPTIETASRLGPLRRAITGRQLPALARSEWPRRARAQLRGTQQHNSVTQSTPRKVLQSRPAGACPLSSVGLPKHRFVLLMRATARRHLPVRSPGADCPRSRPARGSPSSPAGAGRGRPRRRRCAGAARRSSRRSRSRTSARSKVFHAGRDSHAAGEECEAAVRAGRGPTGWISGHLAVFMLCTSRPSAKYVW